MTTLKLNVAGAGKVGRVLARRWQQAGVAEIGGVCCRRSSSAEEAVEFIGAGQVCSLATLPAADLWLISVPDSQIAGVAQALAGRDNLTPALAVHASGALTAAVLAPLAERGWQTASAHPALSFAEPVRALATFEGTPVALEGMEDACQVLDPLLTAIGARPFLLSSEHKPRYHAACTIASNYVVTLADMAWRVAQEAGLDTETARDVLGPLASQSLVNAFQFGPATALTGPVVRGDSGTVALHLDELTDPLDEQAYRALGRLALRLAGGRLDAEHRDALSTLLAEPRG